MKTSVLRRWGLALAGVAIGCGALLPCAVAKPPVPTVPELRDAATRNPVVLVPGIGGTKLRDAKSGRVLWGNARSLFFPRDGGYRMAVSTLPNGALEPELEAFAPVRHIRLLGLLKKEAYGPLERLMEHNGYQSGRLEGPAAGDTFFFLNYDWRKSVVDAGVQLGARLEQLGATRGDEPLEVDLVCQSTAGLVCRWLARYGMATLEEAEAGVRRPLVGVRIDKLILLGSAGNGAIGVLEEMAQGRRYLYGVGRRWRPETLFSYPSLYESLPAAGPAPFMDASGEILDVDLLDPQSWLDYGWSIFREDHARRLHRPAVKRRFGDAQTRLAYLTRMLDRARRLHALLLSDKPVEDLPRYYSLQGAYSMSPARAVLIDGDPPETVFATEKRVRKDPYLNALAHEPGDGHAPTVSQDLLSRSEREALARPAAVLPGSHFEFILSPATQRLLLQFLAE